MIQVLCRGCRKQWYDRWLGVCPVCGTRRHLFNAALTSGAWRTALNEQAAKATRES